MNTIVKLTTSDIKACITETKRRNANGDRLGWAPGGYFDKYNDGGYRQGVEGCLWELAFARFRGVPWEPIKEDFKDADVDGFQVRGCWNITDHLIVRPENPDDMKAALVRSTDLRTHYVVGWILMGEAKSTGEVRNPAKGRAKGACFYVKQGQLTPFGQEPRKPERTVPVKQDYSRWSPEAFDLIRWIKSNPKLPQAPFQIAPGCTVMNLEKFLTGLMSDISGGPGSPRARMGSLQSDLRNLRALAGS